MHSFRSPTVWACKSKKCEFTAPATERAPAAEARHQAEIIALMLDDEDEPTEHERAAYYAATGDLAGADEQDRQERLWWQANR